MDYLVKTMLGNIFRIISIWFRWSIITSI